MKRKKLEFSFKKGCAIGLSLIMTVSMAACGSSGASTSAAANASTANTSATGSEASTSSQSSTGNAEVTVNDAQKTSDQFYQMDQRYPVLKYALSDPPTSLDPMVESGTSPIFTMVYEGLFDDNNGELVPNLCKSYTEVDETHWDLELYDNIYDSDGNNIKASDVEYCFNKLLDSGLATKWEAFDSIKVTGDYTFSITWTDEVKKYGAKDKILNTYIYSQKAAESHNLASETCGTGPYKLAEYVSGASIILEARDDYWNKDSANLLPVHYTNVQRVEFTVVAEAAQNTIALGNGTVDLSGNVPSTDIPDFSAGGSKSQGFQVITGATSDCVFIAGNLSGGITADPNFRKAVYYALDNATISDVAGSSIPCTSLDSSSGKTAHSDNVASWDDEDNYETKYDVDLAKQYLAKTSYNGETLTLIGGNSEQYQNAMVMIQSMLEAVGIKIELQPLEGNVMHAQLDDPNGWDLMMDLYGGPTLADALNVLCSKRASGKTNIFADDQQLYDLYDLAANEETHNAENLTNIYHYLIDNAYYDFLWLGTKVTVMTDAIITPYVNASLTVVPNACTYKL